MEVSKEFFVEEHLVGHEGEWRKGELGEEAVDDVIVWLVVFVAHVEHGLAALGKEYVGMDEDVVGIDAEVVAACADGSGELDELLEEPPAAVKGFGVGVPALAGREDLETQLARGVAEDGGFVNVYESVAGTEVGDLFVARGYDVDVFDCVHNLMAHPLKTQGKGLQVLGHDGDDDVNGL